MIEVEPLLLTLLAQKAQDLETLVLFNMRDATAQVKQEMADLAVSVIQQATVNLKQL